MEAWHVWDRGIYWCPGTKTQEGEIGWDKVGINERIQGSLVRSEEDLHPEVLEKALPLMKEEVRKRTTKSSVEALHDEIVKGLGDNYSKAMGLAKSFLNRKPENIVSFFRHTLTSYEADLRNGCDRYTATLRAHNHLLEILTTYQTFRDKILEVENPPPYFEYHVRLANLPHRELFHIALGQIQERSLQEA